jgi:hypothetical protein
MVVMLNVVEISWGYKSLAGEFSEANRLSFSGRELFSLGSRDAHNCLVLHLWAQLADIRVVTSYFLFQLDKMKLICRRHRPLHSSVIETAATSAPSDRAALATMKLVRSDHIQHPMAGKKLVYTTANATVAIVV